MDEAVEERAALVAESRTAVRVRLELVFGPSILQGHKIRVKLQVLIDRYSLRINYQRTFNLHT